MHARRHLTCSRRFVVALFSVAVLSAAALSGCSNGGGGSSSSRLSKQSLIDRADAICASANKQIAAIGNPDLTNPEATSGAMRRLLDIQHQELKDLRDLEPPKTDTPAINQWLGLVAKALREAGAALAALERSDRNGVNEANGRGGQMQMQADDLARLYGVNGCVSQQATPPRTT